MGHIKGHNTTMKTICKVKVQGKNDMRTTEQKMDVRLKKCTGMFCQVHFESSSGELLHLNFPVEMTSNDYCKDCKCYIVQEMCL